jgi:hypothetical protein
MTVTDSTSYIEQDRAAVWDLVSEITVLISQGANADITDDPLYWALVPGMPADGQRPTEDQWVQGFWLQDLGGDLACAHVGPATDMGAFAPGLYSAWLRILDDPTAPQSVVGLVRIT